MPPCTLDIGKSGICMYDARGMYGIWVMMTVQRDVENNFQNRCGSMMEPSAIIHCRL